MAVRGSEVSEVDLQFQKDIITGLSARQKFMPSKYFYDDEGDKLFQAIMKTPEYYLTNSEYEIFSTKATEILKALRMDGNAFDLVEFGAGDGFKTKVLITRLIEAEAKFRYVPIDISASVLRQLQENFSRIFPQLEVLPHNEDYFEALENLQKDSKNPKLVLFIGSSIGNFREEATVRFLKELYEVLHSGDLALIGFDLKKNPQTILDAYNDKTGVTKAFNLNLLSRINRELEANFDLDAFDHYPYYDPETGFAKSYLVSLKDQEVYIKAAEMRFQFEAGECIHTEISRKYSLDQIESLVRNSGFKMVEHFFDCRHYYVDSLFIKK